MPDCFDATGDDMDIAELYMHPPVNSLPFQLTHITAQLRCLGDEVTLFLGGFDAGDLCGGSG